MITAAGETAATIQDVIDSLQKAISDGHAKPDDIFVTSKDPEGNGFVAFIAEDIHYLGRVGIVEQRNRYSIDSGCEDNAAVVMAMFEIDPVF
jgi:hypothetical protein